MLECVDVAYVGAGVLASALCMDKATFKRLMAEAGVPQVRHEVVTEKRVADRPDAVLVARASRAHASVRQASRLGSSFGISKVSAEHELAAALDAAFQHDPTA